MRPKINALNGSAKYNFNNISGSVYENRKDTKNAIQDLLDDSWETPAENQGNRRPKMGSKYIETVGHNWCWYGL